MTAALWVPGKFSLTNAMLSGIRAAEKFHGRRPKNWHDYYAEEVAAIRLAVKCAATRLGVEALRGESGQVCKVGFEVVGHHKHDPDAWYLLGKAAIDGLVDATVFQSDRREVWLTWGRVLQTTLEENVLRDCYRENWGVVVGGQGVAVFFDWFCVDGRGVAYGCIDA
jgi:hypothetical protein